MPLPYGLPDWLFPGTALMPLPDSRLPLQQAVIVDVFTRTLPDDGPPIDVRIQWEHDGQSEILPAREILDTFIPTFVPGMPGDIEDLDPIEEEPDPQSLLPVRPLVIFGPSRGPLRLYWLRSQDHSTCLAPVGDGEELRILTRTFVDESNVVSWCPGFNLRIEAPRGRAFAPGDVFEHPDATGSYIAIVEVEDQHLQVALSRGSPNSSDRLTSALYVARYMSQPAPDLRPTAFDRLLED